LGPTPRYSFIPRWGLVDQFEPLDQQAADAAGARSGPSVGMVRTTLLVTTVLLGLAAFMHLIRYVLLLVNRSMLLNPLVAGIATWLGVALSVLASFAVVGSAVVLTNWLIARREAAYALNGAKDPRSAWELLVGCLIPLANLLLAPLYVIELARAEGRLTRLRRDIVVWWCVWVLSTALMVWSLATSFTRDTQGIADNTVTTIIAYLAGLAALVLAGRVFLDFERTPVDRPAKRWVIVPEDGPLQPRVATAPEPPQAEEESAVPVESRQREPAA
jgi:hypothetical protein